MKSKSNDMQLTLAARIIVIQATLDENMTTKYRILSRCMHRKRFIA